MMGRVRHRWHDEGVYRRSCVTCGLKAVERPHPYTRRWFTDYTTSDGVELGTLERVPPCEPSTKENPTDDEHPCWKCGELVGYDNDTILARFVGLDVEFAHVACGDEMLLATPEPSTKENPTE